MSETQQQPDPDPDLQPAHPRRKPKQRKPGFLDELLGELDQIITYDG